MLIIVLVGILVVVVVVVSTISVVVLNALLLRGQQTSALITSGIERPCHQMSQHRLLPG